MAIHNIENFDKVTGLNSGDGIKIGYNTIFYNSNPGNCKLCSLDSVSGAISSGKFNEIDKILNKARKLIFNINVTHKEYVEKMSKHFKLVYCVEVPVGYGNGFQFHCCFMTNYKGYSSYKDYEKRIDNTKTNVNRALPVSKNKVVDNTTNKFLELAKKLTPDQFVKLTAYKYPKRAQNYLETILK